MVPEHLSPKQFSRLGGLSLATVHRYLRQGFLPFLQPGGRRHRILIPRQALELLPVLLTGHVASLAPDDAGVPCSTPRLPGPAPRWRGQSA
jgi:hypothetical protein